MNRILKGAKGHPGNLIMILAPLAGAVAGGMRGAGIMLLVFGPLWIVGAWSRGA